MAAAYVVVAWLLIQVAETIFPLFGFDDTPARIVVIVLAIGFIPAVIFAWAFELTPEGLKKESEIDRTQSITPHTGKKLDRMIMVVLALALSYFAFDKFVLDPQREAEQLASLEEQITTEVEQARQEGRTEALVESYGDKSIAVLPFVNMSSDVEQEYFSDGISEELLILLAKIPQLRVISRSSAFSYKGKDIKLAQVADELHVAHILEGSVRKSGKQVRITAQLIEARSDTHLWSETFDRQLDDIFAIQDEIAATVVEQLKITLLGELPVQQKTNPHVYSLYLQGNYFRNLRDKENMEKAFAAYEQALAIDPDYAPAWVGLGYVYQEQTRSGNLPEAEGAVLAMQSVEKALELDPNNAVAWSSLGYLKRTHEWDWKGAKAAIDKALQLEPNNINVLGASASISITSGDAIVAIGLFRKILERDPLDLASLRALGTTLFRQGELDEALDIFNKIKDLNPDYPIININIGQVYLLRGDPARALDEFEKEPNELVRLFNKAIAYFSLGNEDDSLTLLDEYIEKYGDDAPYPVAMIHAWRGENDAAFEWLEKAYQDHTQFLIYILGNEYLKGLHTDPRYPAFLEKMGLLEYWDGSSSEGSTGSK